MNIDLYDEEAARIPATIIPKETNENIKPANKPIS
jgi:hypothetical protein